MNGLLIGAAVVAGCLIGFLALCGWWITHAERGVDPFAGLGEWDDQADAELADLLDAGC